MSGNSFVEFGNGTPSFPSLRLAAEVVAEQDDMPKWRAAALQAVSAWRGMRRVAELRGPRWTGTAFELLEALIKQYVPGAQVASDMLSKDRDKMLGLMHRATERTGFLERNGLEEMEPNLSDLEHATPEDLVEMKLALSYNLSMAHAARFFSIAPATEAELKEIPTRDRMLLRMQLEQNPGSFIGRCCTDKPTAIYAPSHAECLACDSKMEVHEFLAENAGWSETSAIVFLHDHWREITHRALSQEFHEFQEKVGERAMTLGHRSHSPLRDETLRRFAAGTSLYDQAVRMLESEGVPVVTRPPSDPEEIPDRYAEVREAIRHPGKSARTLVFPTTTRQSAHSPSVVRQSA